MGEARLHGCGVNRLVFAAPRHSFSTPEHLLLREGFCDYFDRLRVVVKMHFAESLAGGRSRQTA
jgi:hypothetical protein